MKTEENIKKEIYQYLNILDLNSEELQVIDDFVLQLIESFKPLINRHDKILDSNENIELLKKLILESIGDQGG